MLQEQSKGDKYEACKVANSHALSVASCFQALSHFAKWLLANYQHSHR